MLGDYANNMGDSEISESEGYQSESDINNQYIESSIMYDAELLEAYEELSNSDDAFEAAKNIIRILRHKYDKQIAIEQAGSISHGESFTDDQYLKLVDIAGQTE